MTTSEEPFADVPLFMRIARNWDIAYLGMPLVAFRVHDQTETARLAPRGENAAEVRDRLLTYGRIMFDRRMGFLDEADLSGRETNRYRSLATLRFLADRAGLGVPWLQTWADFLQLVRLYPLILAHPIVMAIHRRSIWRTSAAPRRLLGCFWLARVRDGFTYDVRSGWVVRALARDRDFRRRRQQFDPHALDCHARTKRGGKPAGGSASVSWSRRGGPMPGSSSTTGRRTARRTSCENSEASMAGSVSFRSHLRNVRLEGGRAFARSTRESWVNRYRLTSSRASTRTCRSTRTIST